MRLEGLFQAGIFSEEEIEDKLRRFRKFFFGKENKFSRILNVPLPEDAIEKIQFVDFFRYFDTPVHQIEEYLALKGWVRPSDTGFCSSNCIINDVGIYVYLKDLGYHFYAPPLSWDVRLEQLSRESGLEEISSRLDFSTVDRILKEIGYYERAVIKEAVVIDKEEKGGDRHLCAYIVPAAGISLSLTELREHLSRELPDYMVPSSFIQVEKIPLTTIGKVDTKALLESGGTPLAIESVYVEPRDDEEKILADLCKEIFNLNKIGINDNFFALGANPYNIIQLSTKLKEIFKKDIPVLMLFEYPTIASFLDSVDLKAPGEISGAEDAREDEEWAAARKKGQDKFRKLRDKRSKGEAGD